MNNTDLRRRLDNTIGRLDPPPVPTDAITRRGRGIRRRRAGLAVAVAAGAAAVAVALLPGGTPVRAAPPPPASGSTRSPAGVTNYANPKGWNLFAAGGTAMGLGWRLNVSDVADSGGACIPAVVLNGQDADLLLPHPDLSVTPAGPPAVLTGMVGAADASFAFFRVPPSVTRLVVSAGPAARLTLTPVTETICGKRFRVAGFGFDSANAVRVTAYPSGAGYTLPSSLIQPSPYPKQIDGQWQNLDLSAGQGTPRRVTGGTSAGQPWNIDLSLGARGECFWLKMPRAVITSASPTCGMLVVGDSQPFYELITPVITPTRLYAYAFPLGTQDCWRDTLKLLDGRRVTVTPVTVSGLRLVAFVVPSPVTGWTYKDAAGNITATGSFNLPAGS